MNIGKIVRNDNFGLFMKWFREWTKVVYNEHSTYILSKKTWWKCRALKNRTTSKYVTQIPKGVQSYKTLQIYWRVHKLLRPTVISVMNQRDEGTAISLSGEIRKKWDEVKQLVNETVDTRHLCGFGISKRVKRDWVCCNMRHMIYSVKTREFSSLNEIDKGLHWLLNHESGPVRKHARTVFSQDRILRQALEQHFGKTLGQIIK